MSQVWRLEVLDEISRDGETVILLGDRALLLSPLASALLAHVGSAGASVTDLTTVLLNQFGNPPEGRAEDLVAQAIEQLVGEGVLTWGDVGSEMGPGETNEAD